MRRVAVTLHHYHMPFERNTISVFSNAKKMQKINPLIRIPSLELASGEILIDSWAILDYLDELAGPARALDTEPWAGAPQGFAGRGAGGGHDRKGRGGDL